MIIVTGANGQLGRAVVERLLARVPAAQIGVSVRNPEQAHDLQEQGVRVRRGDFSDRASLDHAFEGASQVLIVSSNSSGESAVSHHRAAIDAARDAGAQRILYTSHMGANPASHFAPMRDHAATEALLQACGVGFTSLRNGFYTTTTLMLLGNALQTGKLAAPADGPVSWTTHADLAEATAIALTHEESLDGPTAPLTGSEALDFDDIAAIASQISGRTVSRVTLPDDEYVAGLVAHGVPEGQAQMLLGLFEASRRGEFAAVSPTLEQLIGRPPLTTKDVLQAALSSAS